MVNQLTWIGLVLIAVSMASPKLTWIGLVGAAIGVGCFAVIIWRDAHGSTTD